MNLSILTFSFILNEQVGVASVAMVSAGARGVVHPPTITANHGARGGAPPRMYRTLLLVCVSPWLFLTSATRG